MSFGSHTENLTAGTTAQTQRLTNPCVMVLLRCPNTNADTVYVSLGERTATTSDIAVGPGESIAVDISSALRLKMALGFGIDEKDFFTHASYYSATASQTLYIDAFAL